MRNVRYDRRWLKDALHRAHEQAELASVLLSTRDLPEEQRQALTDWQKRVIKGAVNDVPPDLELPGYSSVVIDDSVPFTDIRWQRAAWAYWRLEALAPRGDVSSVLAGYQLVAIQVIFHKGPQLQLVRLNGKIRGVFWAVASPGWLDAGWDVPESDRGDCNITVVAGHVKGRGSLLVIGDVAPQIIQDASDEWLLDMQSRSIGVGPARGRWGRLRSKVDRATLAAEVRSALFEAYRQQMHPNTMGTFITDEAEDMQSGSPPARQGKASAAGVGVGKKARGSIQVVSESQLTAPQAPSPLAVPDVTPTTEHLVMTEESLSEALRNIDSLPPAQRRALLRFVEAKLDGKEFRSLFADDKTYKAAHQNVRRAQEKLRASRPG